MNNNYSLEFINRCEGCNTMKPTTFLVTITRLCISLPFRGDSDSLMLKRRPKLAISRTFYVTQLAIIEKSRFKFQQKPKHYVSSCVTSRYVCRFTCKFGNTYIEINNRDLHINADEHIPKRLQKQMNSIGQTGSQDRKLPPSIAKYVIGTGHKFDNKSDYVLFYKSFRRIILSYIEAMFN